MELTRPIELGPMIERAVALRDRFAELEELLYGRPWTGGELTLGLGKDLGDLADLVAERAEAGATAELARKLTHEIGDTWWSLLVIGVRYSIAMPQRIELPGAAGQHGSEIVALRLVGRVGHLMKLVQAKEGVRNVDGLDAEFAETLAAGLRWLGDLVVLYEIDLEASFVELMDELKIAVATAIREAACP